MCRIRKPCRNITSFTGYKLVFKIDNKYYSAFTGIEYKENTKIVPVDEMQKHADYQMWSTIHRNEKMIGKTTVFENLEDAKEIKNVWHKTFPDKEIVILEMTLSGNLHHAIFSERDTIIGEYVETFNQLSE